MIINYDKEISDLFIQNNINIDNIDKFTYINIIKFIKIDRLDVDVDDLNYKYDAIEIFSNILEINVSNGIICLLPNNLMYFYLCYIDICKNDLLKLFKLKSFV